MKVKEPEPFTFEAGNRAVLLLHGFTGHSADVRMLGRFLEKHGYTSHAPIYRGHGKPPEELIESRADQWWADVTAAFQKLKDMDYEEIAVAGLSLGGVLSLKLAYSENIKGVISMCAPMFFDNESQLTEGFRFFSKEYKQLEKKDEETINKELDELLGKSEPMFEGLGKTINEVRNNIDTIYTPTFVVQAEKDQMINTDSATYIHDHVETDRKQIKWYEESGHVITMDKEKDELHEDILEFLNTLDWKE